jgi:hypothetical protein
MTYTIYSETTGQILRVVQTNDIQAQLQDGETYIQGSIDDSDFYIENGEAVEIASKPDQYSVFDFTTKQWVQDETMAVSDVSSKRQRLLYASDWTQLSNGPLTTAQQAAWATYRQELRDIPLQTGYPFSVIWPVAPM